MLQRKVCIWNDKHISLCPYNHLHTIYTICVQHTHTDAYTSQSITLWLLFWDCPHNSEMKMLLVKPKETSLIPKNYKVDGESGLWQVVLWSPHAHFGMYSMAHAPTCKHTHVNKINKNVIIIKIKVNFICTQLNYFM